MIRKKLAWARILTSHTKWCDREPRMRGDCGVNPDVRNLKKRIDQKYGV
jgi:hypothetical protein